MHERLLAIIVCLFVAGCSANNERAATANQRDRPRGGRSEVVFWHFWGGRDRPVVEAIVERFNASQDRYQVRAVAMPGSNLDLKFFLSVAGGDPPDLLNQDDPIVADWASRGALTPLGELASDGGATGSGVDRLEDWLFPAAQRLAKHEGRWYALANGLDVRALYVNKTLLREHGLPAPRTLEDLDRIAKGLTPDGDGQLHTEGRLRRVGYLPDPRRLWAWGVVFGGRFYNPAAEDPAAAITCDSTEVVAALEWMAGPSRRLGADRVAAFRTGDQGLTGAAFPLLADRRYAAIMDGQWRVRDLVEAEAAAAAQGEPIDEFIVTPLPPPTGGREGAGWVNGNFFVVPRGAKNPSGAWEFMKFWSGFGGNEAEAAQACAAGGWVPVSQRVVDQPEFQDFLDKRPRFRAFVELAASENQFPIPPIPAGPLYQREVNAAAQDVLYRGADPATRLQQVAERMRRRLSKTSSMEAASDDG